MLAITMALLAVAAPAQENRSRRFAPGVCGPADPTYIRTAEETGGIPMFLLPSEISATTKLMLITSGSNSVTVLWAKGTLQGAPREFSVPLDSTLERVAFSFSVDTHGTSMEVVNPSGVPINSGGGADVEELNCGRLVILTKPFPGPYRVRVTGTGRFWLAVEGRSDIFLHGLRFVEPGGRPGHEGYFPIAGQPLAGKPATLEASISGMVKSAAFDVVSVSNETIRRLDMKAMDSEPGRAQYFGTFDLPDSAFRVSVTGRDENGHAYQRVFHTLFHPATVAIVAEDEGVSDVPPGKTTVLSYVVRNVGSAAEFRVVPYAGRGFETHVEPGTLNLASGASAKVRVSVTIPDSAPPGTGFDLTVSVSKVDDPALFNGTSRHLSVNARQ